MLPHFDELHQVHENPQVYPQLGMQELFVVRCDFFLNFNVCLNRLY